MSKQKIGFIALGILALTAALINFAVPKREKTPIRVVVLSDIIPTLPHWVAVEQSFYQSEGLEPKEYSFTSSNEPISAIANGDADFLPGVSMLDAMDSVAKHRLTSTIMLSHCRVSMAPSFDSLLVANGSSISNLKDLEGKTIAVFPGQTATEILKYFLAQKGVNVSNIHFKQLPPNQHLQALQSGEVACTHTYEPFRSACLDENRMRELYGSVYASLNEPAAIGATLISYKLWNESKPLVEKLIRVWDRSIKFIREHPVEARWILRKRLNLSDAVAQKATWVNATLSYEIDRKTVEATISTYKKMGILQDSFEFDPSFYYAPPIPSP
jgi:ABC-type nitrate/sulfonate/bicarbonate transport system substrate-binding protein